MSLSVDEARVLHAIAYSRVSTEETRIEQGPWVVNALVSRGLVRRNKLGDQWYAHYLTDAGREALAEHEAQS